MYSTKMARLRIDQDDLKCRRGCGYYGNAQFDGLCSKCFREQNEKHKKSKSLVSSRIDPNLIRTQTHINNSTTSHRQPQPHYPKQSQQSQDYYQSQKSHSPSKSTGESQTGATRKKPLLSVFQKTSYGAKTQKKQEVPYVPDRVENEFLTILKSLKISDETKHKLKYDIQNLDKEIRNHLNAPQKNIDELSEIVQNAYTRLAESKDDRKFANISADIKEDCIDFFEKVIMTRNHKHLFSPYFTTDEENDAKIQKRIRQLSWITSVHLLCSIDEANSESRDLVYNGITELVAMDSFYSPKEKLECVVKCCRNIFALLKKSVGGPASADEFLPALIFVVLKANPVRLHSNINYINRFSNSSRLMSGECGYYFTNLCCAISFIENLNHESLSMSAEEFDELMTGERKHSTPWESALLACESLNMISENLKKMDVLKKRNSTIMSSIQELSDELKKFEDEITKKVDETLKLAPLTIKPIKTPDFLLDQIREIYDTTSPVELEPKAPCGHFTKNIMSAAHLQGGKSQEILPMPIQPTVNQANRNDNSKQLSTKDTVKYLNLPVDQRTAVTPTSTSPAGGHLMPASNSTEILYASPIFNYSSFDTQSLDSLVTPDDSLNPPDFTGGITNINYDFDLSDLSGENSIAEDGATNSLKLDLQEFDPLAQKSELILDGTASRNTLQMNRINNEKPKTLFESDSPNEVALQSPLKPIACDYRGFSNFQIPSIDCNTGDFSSLNMSGNSNGFNQN